MQIHSIDRPPQLTQAQRDALTGVPNGARIYNTTAQREEVYENGVWSPRGSTNAVPLVLAAIGF